MAGDQDALQSTRATSFPRSTKVAARMIELLGVRPLARADALTALVFLVMLFPFFQVLPNSSDIQPHISVVAAAILLWLAVRNVSMINGLLLPALAVPIIGFSFGDSIYEIVRATAIYGGVFAVYAFTQHAIRQGFPIISLLKVVLLTNFVIGALQALTNPFIFDFLVPVRTSLDRGVTALSVEPSFYGMSMTLLTLVIFGFSRKSAEKAFFFAIGFIQVAVLSQSSLAVLILVAAISFYVITHIRLRWSILLLAALFAAGAFAFAFVVPTDTRLYSLVMGFVQNPLKILAGDRSMAIRVSHVVLSNYGAVMSLLVPNGFSAFSEFVLTLQDWSLSIVPSNRILSAYGGAFFELGIFALPLIIYNFMFLGRRATSPSRRTLLVIAIAVFMTFLNALSFALPLYAICLAIINNSAYIGPMSATRS